MKDLNIKITVNAALFLKDPDSSSLGRKIITESILLINKLGFEQFTFKKLSQKIQSPESSIYRYFKNKHTLLVYLTNWYWSWMEYRVVLATTNINNPLKKLKKALNTITEEINVDAKFSYINEIILHKIIIAESVKAFHTKYIDEENKKGCFDSYKHLINRVSSIISEVNSSYKYPKMLITTVIEGVHQQWYFLNHLPSLIDNKEEEKLLQNFYIELVMATISKK